MVAGLVDGEGRAPPGGVVMAVERVLEGCCGGLRGGLYQSALRVGRMMVGLGEVEVVWTQLRSSRGRGGVNVVKGDVENLLF